MSKTILIVEDCDITREIISTILKDLHPEENLLAAADPAKASALLEDNDIDLIISDVMMPGQTGIEFVSEVRQIEKFKETPIIMLTTVGKIKEMQKGKAAGANSWLTKPVDRDRLKELTTQYL